MADPEHIDILMEGVDVWNKWREDNLTIGADFSDADLSGVDLAYMDAGSGYKELRDYLYEFHRENIPIGEDLVKFCRDNEFKEADFHQPTDFSNARLEGANLEGANLEEAILAHVNLRKANLSKAVLERANLKGADLSNAELSNSKMAYALLENTLFRANDLSNVLGLDRSIHWGPSIIDIRTLELSSGKIPSRFLRGVGITDHTIKNVLPLYAEVSADFFSCFISYNHQDKSFAERLYEGLQNRGIRCWLDKHQLLPGDDIYDSVDRGIRLTDKVLLCCSEHSLKSWWVDNEIETAFEKERKLMKERGRKILSLIPLNLDGYMFKGEWESGKERQIKSRLVADFTGWENENSKFEKQFEKIVKALRVDEEERWKPLQQKL